jgi:hypothetical protein
MDIHRVRELLNEGKIELEFSLPHALVEAKKDGLTEKNLTAAVWTHPILASGRSHD